MERHANWDVMSESFMERIKFLVGYAFMGCNLTKIFWMLSDEVIKTF